MITKEQIIPVVRKAIKANEFLGYKLEYSEELSFSIYHTFIFDNNENYIYVHKERPHLIDIVKSINVSFDFNTKVYIKELEKIGF
jgi:hypothetical protein